MHQRVSAIAVDPELLRRDGRNDAAYGLHGVCRLDDLGQIEGDRPIFTCRCNAIKAEIFGRSGFLAHDGHFCFPAAARSEDAWRMLRPLKGP